MSWSRASILNGLEIIGNFTYESLTKRDNYFKKVYKEYLRLKENCQLNLNLNYLDNINNNGCSLKFKTKSYKFSKSSFGALHEYKKFSHLALK